MNSALIACFVAILVIGIVECQQKCEECTEDQCCVGIFMKRCRPLLEEGKMCGLGGFFQCSDCARGLECVRYRCASTANTESSSSVTVPSTSTPTVTSGTVSSSAPAEETTIA